MFDTEVEKSTSEYTDEQRDNLIVALNDCHSSVNHAGSGEPTERVYVVMAFTEYEDGLAGSLGVFGSDGIPELDDLSKMQAARTIAKTGQGTLASSIAVREIRKQLDDWTSKAISVSMGAKLLDKITEAESEAAEELIA